MQMGFVVTFASPGVFGHSAIMIWGGGGMRHGWGISLQGQTDACRSKMVDDYNHNGGSTTVRSTLLNYMPIVRKGAFTLTNAGRLYSKAITGKTSVFDRISRQACAQTCDCLNQTTIAQTDVFQTPDLLICRPRLSLDKGRSNKITCTLSYDVNNLQCKQFPVKKYTPTLNTGG